MKRLVLLASVMALLPLLASCVYRPYPYRDYYGDRYYDRSYGRDYRDYRDRDRYYDRDGYRNGYYDRDYYR
ncbi:MAG TPA: hypothetical protein VN723_02945 [Rhizomicrobium sp.]|jgi:hypothetical protein|nr:hypothetical protein [Rhizomicrobium sp.]